MQYVMSARELTELARAVAVATTKNMTATERDANIQTIFSDAGIKFYPPYEKQAWW